MIPLDDHTARSTRRAYRQWLRFFGPPRVVLCDLGKEFQADFVRCAEADGSEVDPASLEMPQQRGLTERAGGIFKTILYKAMETYSCDSWDEWRQLVDITCFAKKRLLMRSGYSPIQRVIGYSPRLPGGLLSDGEQDLSTASLAGIGDIGVTKQMEMRKAAATAFHETDCEQAIKNATLAGPRPHRNFEAGQVVYFWRRGADTSKKPTANYWHGPARVILTNLPNSVWLSYQ